MRDKNLTLECRGDEAEKAYRGTDQFGAEGCGPRQWRGCLSKIRWREWALKVAAWPRSDKSLLLNGLRSDYRTVNQRHLV